MGAHKDKPMPEGVPSFPGLDNILLGDVLAVLAKIPRESVHLIVTSPPYNLEKPYADAIPKL